MFKLLSFYLTVHAWQTTAKVVGWFASALYLSGVILLIRVPNGWSRFNPGARVCQVNLSYLREHRLDALPPPESEKEKRSFPKAVGSMYTHNLAFKTLYNLHKDKKKILLLPCCSSNFKVLQIINPIW